MSKLNAELALALALDGKLAKLDDETATLVAVVDALRALPEPEIDVNFANALEQRLLSEGLADETPVAVGRPQLRVVPAFPETPADEAIRVADNVVTMPTRRFKVRRSVAALAACFMLGAFPVMAASSALPGSPFYGIKQRIHAAQLALFGDAASDASRRLGFASEHVREAEALVALGASEDLISSTLDLATYELAKAGETISSVTDPESLARFAEEAASTESLLRKSGPALAPEASDAFDRALEAASTLTDAIKETLGIGPAGATVGSAANEVQELFADAPNEAPTTVSGDASGSTKVSTGQEPGPDDTKRPPTEDKDDDGDGRVGKGLEDAAKSCELPGAVQIDQLAGDLIDTEVCTSAAVAY